MTTFRRNTIRKHRSFHALRPDTGLGRVLYLVVVLAIFVTNTSAAFLATAHFARMKAWEFHTWQVSRKHAAEPAQSAGELVGIDDNSLLEVTPFISPTLTLTPVVTETPPPTQVVTPTATLPAPPKGGYTLTLTTVPISITPGAPFTLIWEIGDWSQTPGIEMQVVVPSGITPSAGYPGVFDPGTGVLTFTPDDYIGKLSWDVDKAAYGPYPLESSLILNKAVVASASLLVQEEGVSQIPQSGGTAQGMEDKVTVEVPSGTLPEPIDLRIQEPASNPPPTSLSGNPFRLTAIGQNSGQEITQFSKSLTVQIAYDETTLRGPEVGLQLFYYDEKLATWVPLESQVDTANNILTGYTDHFSDFDIDVTSWQAARTPTMQSFQVSQFTGAATYGMPLWVPPGPGGFQPSVNLSYNSQVVDSALTDTQASWVGMGWSLDGGGSIERNMHGSNDFLDDDTFSIVVGGMSSLMLPVQDQDNNPNTVDYHTTDENFWRIRYYKASYGGALADTWVVWDKSGMTYSFGTNASSNNSRAQYEAYPDYLNDPDECDPTTTTWRWGLSEAKNLHGLSITYTYALENKAYRDPCHQAWPVADVAMYPDTIVYPNGLYRVKFITEGRTDFDSAWETENSMILFERSRLDTVRIQRYNGSIWTTIREYDLTYGSSPVTSANQVYPNITWSEGGKTSTLISVQEYGVGGVSGGNSLPATTFAYDGAHLDYASNGYGGRVDFNYASWHETTGAPDSRKLDTPFDTAGECGGTPPTTNGWLAVPGTTPPGAVACNGNQNLQINGNPAPYEAWHDLGQSLTQPGAVYILSAKILTTGNSQIRLGMHDTVANLDYLGNWQSASSSTWISTTLTLPATIYKTMELRMACNGSGTCEIEEYKLTLAPMRYRVTSKVLYPYILDPNTSYTFQYSYLDNGVDSGKTNRPGIYNGGSNPYVNFYAEFRGNGRVTEIAPDGTKTVTGFLQDDARKGQPMDVYRYDSTGKLIGANITYYDYSAPSGITISYPEDGGDDYTGLFIYWTRPNNQENYICDGSPCIQTRQLFEYNASGEQLGSYGGNQYGNLTRVIEQKWGGSAWVDYRATRTWYVPNGGTPYLVSLPAATVLYACPGGTCDNGTSDALSARHFIYDDNTDYSGTPIYGKLTDLRVWIDNNGEGGSARYSQVSYVYDTYGNVSQQKTWSTYTSYNADPTSSARVTYSYYDSTYNTYLVEVRNPIYHATNFPATFFTYDYDKAVPLTITDPNDQDTSATYDAFGRILTVVRPGDTSGSPTVSISYTDSYPFKTVATQKITSSVNMSVEKYYDGLGRLLQSQVANATVLCGSSEATCDIIANTYYDSAGRPWAQPIPYAAAPASGFQSRNATPDAPYTQTLYDAAGRAWKTIATDSSYTEYTYALNTTAQTSQVSVKDPLNNTTVTHADVWGRVIEVHAPLDPWTRYTYNEADQLTVVEQMSGASPLSGFTTNLYYDFGGRKTSMSDPDMGSWSYAYNAVGGLTKQTDARGCVTTFGYDALDRLTSKTYTINSGAPASCNNTPDVTYTYDTIVTNYFNIGQRTAMSDTASNTTNYRYDNRGQLAVMQNVINGSGTFKTLYSYNSAGMLSGMTYPSNNTGGTDETVSYSYLPQGALDTLGTSYSLGRYVNNSIYDAPGRLDTRELGQNGSSAYIYLNYDYHPWDGTPGNSQGRLQKIQAGTSLGGTSLQNLEYTFDALGNVKTTLDVNNSAQKQCYGYDTLYRLTSAAVGLNNGTCSSSIGNGEYADETYTYGANNGTLASKTGPGTLAYTENAHKHAVTLTDSNSYGYDANGNQTTRTIGIGGPTQTLTYDAENRLVTVKQGSTTIATFVYDGDGARIKSTINGATTAFVGTHFEWTGSTGTMVKYYYAGAVRIAMRTGSSSANSSVKWLLGDLLGSTSLTTNFDGASPVTQLYKPWGEVRYNSGALPTKYTYTGQYSNMSDFGLMFYNARWYDPALGRFAQADTIIPQALSSQDHDRYSYVRNNPLRYTDPTGHFTEDEMCKYWGYCGDDASNRFKNDFGDRLWGIMWGTSIGFGDLLIWDEGNSIAMFVLFENSDGTFSGGLWSITGGTRVYLSGLKEVDKIAGYQHDPGDPNDPSDDVSNVIGMDPAEFYSWFGGEDPKFNFSSDDLHVLDVDQGQVSFYTYVDAGFWWWADLAIFLAGLGIMLIPGFQLLGAGLAIGSGVLGAAGFSSGLLGTNLLQGPVDARYPVVMYVNPAAGYPGRSGAVIHLNPPKGGW